MYKLNFDELVKNYIKKIKSRQLKRKVELLDIFLLVFLFILLFGFACSLLLDKECLAFSIDIVMIIEVSFLWFRNKNYDEKHSKEIEFRKKENIKIKQNCLRECLCEKSIDVNNSTMIDIVSNEYSNYYLNNQNSKFKIIEWLLSILLQFVFALISLYATLTKDVTFSLLFYFSTLIIAAYCAFVGVFMFGKKNVGKNKYLGEIHDILLDINLRNAQKK